MNKRFIPLLKERKLASDMIAENDLAGVNEVLVIARLRRELLVFHTEELVEVLDELIL